MAMKLEDNEMLTAVGANTPMGALLRQYWVPALRSSALERDGAPVRVTLFGDKFVAFRTTDGAAGFMDEACPHRGVSLALARNEENGLRCIFHGWKFDATGRMVDAPAEPEARREAFCQHIRTSRYAVREAAGLVWVYLGAGPAPAFPTFEFSALPPENVCIRRAVVPYNWVQGVEAHVDSSHVAFLHGGFLTKNKDKMEEATAQNLAAMMVDRAPRFEMDHTAYGLREGALRNMGKGQTYARIREIVLPFYTFIPGPEEGPFSGRISVPIDEHSSSEWYVLYNPNSPLTEGDIHTLFHGTSDDPDNFAANMGEPSNLWGQDRQAMKEGHFSGFPTNLSFEDFVVQASMGSRVDRSKEQLSAADAIIVTVRRLLVQAAKAHAAGQAAPWNNGFDYEAVRARSVTYTAPNTWRDFTPAPATEHVDAE